MNEIVDLSASRAARNASRPGLVVPARGGVMGIGLAIAAIGGLLIWVIVIGGIVAVVNWIN